MVESSNEMTETNARINLRYGSCKWEDIPMRFKNIDTLAYWVARGQSGAIGIHNHLPKKYHTVEFYEKILNENPMLPETHPSIFKEIVPALNTKDLDRLFTLSTALFPLLSESQLSIQYCKLALDLSCQYFEYIPESFLSEDIIQYYLAITPRISNIPSNKLTERLIKIALKKAVYMVDADLVIVPKILLTDEVYAQLLEDPLRHLKFIPKNLLTKDICLNMLAGREFMGFQLNHIYQHIPESIRDEVWKNAKFFYHRQPGEPDHITL